MPQKWRCSCLGIGHGLPRSRVLQLKLHNSWAFFNAYVQQRARWIVPMKDCCFDWFCQCAIMSHAAWEPWLNIFPMRFNRSGRSRILAVMASKPLQTFPSRQWSCSTLLRGSSFLSEQRAAHKDMNCDDLLSVSRLYFAAQRHVARKTSNPSKTSPRHIGSKLTVSV